MNAVTGRVKKAGCFASSSYLPSAELPASMDLDVVFLPIPIIKRKWLVWLLGCTGWKRRLVQAAIPGSEVAFLAARAPDSQAEMNPTSTISQHLGKREQPSHQSTETTQDTWASHFSSEKSKLCQTSKNILLSYTFQVPTPLHLRSLTDSKYPLERRPYLIKKYQNPGD